MRFRIALGLVAVAEGALGATLMGSGLERYLWATAVVTLAFGLIASRLLEKGPPPPPRHQDEDDPPEPEPNPPWWPAFEADLRRYEQENTQTLTSRRSRA